MQPKIIAIIDDEPEMEDLYLLIFEPLIDRELVELHFFHDGLTFLNWFRKNRPDLLLCDINLPGMNGSELIEEIRRIEKNNMTPSIQFSFVSGYHPEQYASLMDRHQVTRFITKPLAVKETLALIEKDLGLVSP
jgi:CheY-like chemotaxis protein